MSSPIPIRSPGQAKVRTAGQARQTQVGSISIFSLVTAKIPLNGFGPFNTSGSNTSSLWQGGGSSASQWVTNSAWPNVYAVMTETWTEPTATQTVTTTNTTFHDTPITTSTVNTGSGFSGSGSVSSFSLTATAVTIDYSTAHGPATYIAQLSGTALNPTGTGPFNPTDPTYGWAALTSAANALLGSISTPAVGANSQFTTLQPKSVAPGYVTGTFSYDLFGSLVDVILCAANGYPVLSATGGGFAYPVPSIFDYTSPYNAASFINTGWCISTKSIWQLNGDTWWNAAYGPTEIPQWVGDHSIIFALPFDPSNFTTAQLASAASTFSNPVPWPVSITFAPTDVTANTGAGTYGMLGFQANPY